MPVESASVRHLAKQAHIPPSSSHHPQIDERSDLPFTEGVWSKGIPYYVPPQFDNSDTADPRGLFILRTMPEKHHRSAELTILRSTDSTEHTRHESRFKPTRVIFPDEYGNWYSVLNAKGMNLMQPTARITPLSDTRHAIKGLADDTYRMRIERSSRLFRQAGIDTEWPVYTYRPAHFALPGQKEPAELSEVKTYASKHYKTFPGANPTVTIEEGLTPHEPIAIVRAMKVSERLWDVPIFTDPENDLFGDCVRLHNFDLNLRIKQGTYNEALHGHLIDKNLHSDEQWHTYIARELPIRIGRNVGLMHALGVKHNFLHAGNVTLFGEIVDLDSPEGHNVLGFGPDATIQEKSRDLRMLMYYTWLNDFDLTREEILDFKESLFTTYCAARNLSKHNIEYHVARQALGFDIKATDFLDKSFEDALFNLTADIIHLGKDVVVDEDTPDHDDPARAVFDTFMRLPAITQEIVRLQHSTAPSEYEPDSSEYIQRFVRECVETTVWNVVGEISKLESS